MAMELLPEWMAGLEEEEVAFIRKFILASGALKEVAGQYGGHRRRPLHRHHQAAGDERKTGPGHRQGPDCGV